MSTGSDACQISARRQPENIGITCDPVTAVVTRYGTDRGQCADWRRAENRLSGGMCAQIRHRSWPARPAIVNSDHSGASDHDQQNHSRLRCDGCAMRRKPRKWRAADRIHATEKRSSKVRRAMSEVHRKFLQYSGWTRRSWKGSE